MTELSTDLPQFERELRKLFPELRISPVQVMGRVDSAGDSQPLLASAARLSIDNDTCWHVPWPEPEEPQKSSLPGRVFLWSGITYVFPTIRLRVEQLMSRKHRWEFLTLDDWLTDALTCWLLPRKNIERISTETRQDFLTHFQDSQSTVFEQLQKGTLTQKEKLRAVGNLIRYAIRGPRSENIRKISLGKNVELRLPKKADDWLRSFSNPMKEDNEFSHHDATFGKKQTQSASFRMNCLRSLVITGCVERNDDVPEGAASQPLNNIERKRLGKYLRNGSVPRISHAGYKLDVAQPDAQGIDPFHTPESEQCRSRLHLGADVRVVNRSLVTENKLVSLSPSTIRLPFAGYNDPRRLLLAAKAQQQAVSLEKAEHPLVITDANGSDPDGINLRVGYLAWAGWNHEDAWVLSESAAAKLTCVDHWTQTVSVSHFERPLVLPEDRPFKSHRVRGNNLLPRQILPAMLGLDLHQIAGMLSAEPNLLQTNCFSLPPDKEETIQEGECVEHVESWKKAKDGWVNTCDPSRPVTVPLDFDAKYQQIIQFHLCRKRKLEVGDKLATRHGHKGVVGLILPDERMPKWDGKPLEALIDPISVLNRLNWGQIYESLAGAIAVHEGCEQVLANERLAAEWLSDFQNKFQADDWGRVKIEPPTEGWLAKQPRDKIISAMAGVQFVMRLPQHAADTLAYHDTEQRGVKVSLQSHFALWAHGLTSETAGIKDLKGLTELERVLRLAGIELELVDEEGNSPQQTAAKFLRLRYRDLAGDPPAEWIPFEPKHTGRHDSMEEQLAALDSQKCYYLKFKHAIQFDSSHLKRSLHIRWFPVVSDPEWNKDRSKHVPRYFKALADLVRAVCPPSTKHCNEEKTRRIENRIDEVIRESLKRAIGSNNEKDRKKSLLCRKIQAYRRGCSGRAIVTPSGLPVEDVHRQVPSDHLDLWSQFPHGINEVGLPSAIFQGINQESKIGSLPKIHEVANENALPVTGFKKTSPAIPIWLQRDPVLHRWGFLPVQAREIKDLKTIRLAASLLEPLGCDYDGDAAAVLAILRNQAYISERLSPSTICRHDFQQTLLFKPSKQYLYGLHLLQYNVELLTAFQIILDALDAPCWPVEIAKVTDRLNQWLEQVAMSEKRDGCWWAVLERFALLALANDPGMGLGIPQKREDLATLAVLQCGAAKGSIYGIGEKPGSTPKSGKQISMAEAILRGESLTIHQKEQGESQSPHKTSGIDPIGSIMAEAHKLKKDYGGQIKQFVCRTREVDAEIVKAAQTLTEMLTQKVLSVKTLDTELPPFGKYRKKARRWLDDNHPCNEKIEGVRDEVLEKLDGGFWLDRSPRPPLPNWQKWLEHPEKLPKLLKEHKELWLPLDDLRVQPFISRILPNRH